MMRKRHQISLILILSLALTASIATEFLDQSESPAKPASAAGEAPFQLIVTGKAASLQKLREQMGDLAPTDVFSSGEQNVLKKLGKPDLAQSFVIQTKGSIDAEAIRKRIARSGQNVKIEENRKARAQAADPLEAEQWGLRNTGKTQREFIDYFNSRYIPGVRGEDVQLPPTSKQGEGVTIAVIDTAIDVKHPDLASQIRRSESECAAYAEYEKCLKGATPAARVACETKWQKTDTDGNGYPMDCQGWNAIGPKNKYSGLYGTQFTGLKPSDLRDGLAHGTHVAGIVSAAINGDGVQGIAPKAKILPISVIGENPGSNDGTVTDNERASALTTVVARGLLYAIAAKANIVNLSLGWNGRAEATPSSEIDAPIMREMIKLAQERGILVVSAAGNDGTDALVFPCQYSEVICVAAHSNDGQIARFSNYGSGVDIAAPGQNILSTIPNDIDAEIFTARRGFDYKDGTSMAAPYVAGALAVLISGGVPPKEAYARLLAGARQRPFVETKMTLTGNLDVTRALKATPRPMIVPVEKGVLPTIWDPREDSVPMEVPLKNIWSDAKNVTMTLRPSQNDEKLGHLRLPVTQFNEASWKSGETKTLKFDIQVTSPRIASEVFVILEIEPANGILQTLRLPIQISLVLTKSLEYTPNAKAIPIVSGQMNPSPQTRILTILALDGKPGLDYLAVEPAQQNWKYQIIRETPAGYVAGPIGLLPAISGGVRVLQRLDLNFDGKSEYVLTHLVDPPRVQPTPGSTSTTPKARVPYFKFDFVDENVKPVFEPFTFKNETAVLQLEKFQWVKSGSRLVPIWVDVGRTPIAERQTVFDPWNPNPGDPLTPRVYYFDPATADGLRSLSFPEQYKILGVMQASLEQRKQGIVPLLFSDKAFVASYFVNEIAAIGQKNPTFKPVDMAMANYRNLKSLENAKLVILDPTATTISGQAYSGPDVTNAVRSNAVFADGRGGYTTFDVQTLPSQDTDIVYKTISTALEGEATRPTGLASFSQGLYELKYRDSTSDQTFETSLRRYTFVAAALFERSFVPAVAETNGQRVAAIQIPDGFGAYPGAEVIAPIRDASGRTLGLIRPAMLRVQVAPSSQCEWLSRTEPTASEPSQAAYFCGDKFVRIPYRF